MKVISKVHGAEYNGKTYSFHAIFEVEKKDEESFRKDSRFDIIEFESAKKEPEKKVEKIVEKPIEKPVEVTRALDESNKPKKIFKKQA